MEETAERKSLAAREPEEPLAAAAAEAEAEAEAPSDQDMPRDPDSAQLVAVQGLNRPFFHFDLQEAVEAALLHKERDD